MFHSPPYFLMISFKGFFEMIPSCLLYFSIVKDNVAQNYVTNETEAH